MDDPATKKRQRLSSHGGGARLEEPEITRYEQEIAKLRRQVVELKDIAVKALARDFDVNDWLELSEEWRTDRAIVEAAVQLNSEIFSRLPRKWATDADILVSAMAGYGGSRWFRNNIPGDCFLHPKVTTAALQHRHFDEWDQVPLRLKRDPMVVRMALEKNVVDWHDVPTEIKTTFPEVAFYGLKAGHIHRAEDCLCLMDREFFSGEIRSGGIHEMEHFDLIPEEFQNDLDFVRNIAHLVDTKVTVMLMQKVPELCQDRSFWCRVVALGREHSSVYGLLEQTTTPQTILSDRELMTKACRINPNILKLVDASLGNDRVFLERLLPLAPAALPKMSREAQRLFPDMIMNMFEVFVSQRCFSYWGVDVEGLPRVLAPELWDDRQFVLRYFASGLPFAASIFPASWKDDGEIFLLIAKHCQKDLRRQSFEKASVALRSKKDFLLQVLERDTSLFCCAAPRLQQNFDVALRAFAGPVKNVERYIDASHYDGQDDFVRQCHSKIGRMLDLHKDFVSTILQGMSPPNDDARDGSTLSVLNQGVETSIVFKRLIAQYLDIPTGKRLTLLRRAYSNLSEAMKDWHGRL